MIRIFTLLSAAILCLDAQDARASVAQLSPLCPLDTLSSSFTSEISEALSLDTLNSSAPEHSPFTTEAEEEEAERLDPEFATAENLELDTIALPSSGWEALLPKCARPDSNFISLPGGLSPEMSRFIDKMDSVLLYGKGRVSILHIGGSHVQADMYTNEFRIRIDSLNNGLRPPRGYLFPFRVAKTNNPTNFRVTAAGRWDKARCSVRKQRPPLGIDGISVWTSDPTAWIGFDMDPNRSGRWTSTALKVIGRSVPSPTGQHLTPIIRVDGQDVRPSSYDVRTMTYSFRLPKPSSCFTLHFAHSARQHADSLKIESAESSASRATFYVDGIIPENEEDGIVYHTVGVNGAAVPHYLKCEYFERQMGALCPDLVILSVGINDASGPNFVPDNFKSNYDQLLRVFRRINPNCAFIFITNNDSKRRVSRRKRIVNKNGELAEQAFREIATKWQGGLWDLFDIMGGLGSMAEWQKNGLAGRDNIHFSRLGYKVVGALFYDAFLNFYLDQDPVEQEDATGNGETRQDD